MLPMATKLIVKVKGWLKSFRGLDDSTKKTIVTIALLAAALGPVLIIIGKLSVGIAALIPIFTAFNVVIRANPIAMIVTAIAALIGALYWLLTSTSDTARKIKNFFIDMANVVIDSINVLINGFNKINPFKSIPLIKKFAKISKKELEEVGDEAEETSKKVEAMGESLDTSGRSSKGTGSKKRSNLGTNEEVLVIPIQAIELTGEDQTPELFTAVEQEWGNTVKTLEEQTAYTTQVMVEDFQNAADNIKKVMGGLGDVFSAANEKAQVEFDIWKETQEEKKGVLDEELEREMKRIEVSGMNEQRKAEAKEKIEEEFAAKKEALDAQIEKKERAMKRRQAVRDKAMKIASAIMSTAEAVTSVIANPILAAIVGALGAIQVATIASTPIPFGKGGLVSGPTLGLIGEGSGTSAFNPEVVSPLDKLMGMMGATEVDVHGRIEGNNIVLVSDKAQISRQRFI